MDPNAALRMIDEADRVDAETREFMRGFHQWLSRGGFAPDWTEYPTGTRRYRKAYGGRVHSTKDPTASVVKLKDRYSGGHVWLTVRDGVVVGVMGSDPKRYIGMPIDRARHVARYGGSGESSSRGVRQGTVFTGTKAAKKTSPTRGHATVARAGNGGTGGIQIGDIVQRADAVTKNRYVVVDVQSPWIHTRRISGSGAPGIITFPSTGMLRKVG